MDDADKNSELRAAKEAVRAGRYAEADRLLDQAAHAGADPLQISNIGRDLRLARLSHEQSVTASIWMGFILGLIGYLILSTRQPVGWGPSVWYMLTFLAIPGITGLLVGWRHAGQRSMKHAFVDGAKAGAYSMACYAGFNLILLFNHLQKDETQLGDEFFAAAITTIMFSLLAGAITGVASVLASRILPKGASA